MRITIRVRPGAARPAVGGRYGTGCQSALVVAVSDRAVDGAATRAALRSVAAAFGVSHRDVRLVSGARSRTKILEIPDEAFGGPGPARAALERLLGD